MRRVIISILVMFLFISDLCAQDTALILTEQQNEAWLDTFFKRDLGGRLQLLRQRILDDTSVYIQSDFGDRIVLERRKDLRKVSFRKPLLIVDGVVIRYGDNDFRPSEAIQLAQLLTVDHIKTADMLAKDKASSLFGSPVFGGLLVITTKTKQDRRRFRAFQVGRSS